MSAGLLARLGFVHPARLRNAQASQVFTPRGSLQQRDLQGKREFG